MFCWRMAWHGMAWHQARIAAKNAIWYNTAPRYMHPTCTRTLQTSMSFFTKLAAFVGPWKTYCTPLHSTADFSGFSAYMTTC